MLQEIVLAGWAVTAGLTAAVGVRIAMVLRHPPGTSAIHQPHDETEAGRLAVEQLLAEVGGVVDLIEADAARLEGSEDGRSLSLARSLLASSISRYQEAATPEG